MSHPPYLKIQMTVSLDRKSRKRQVCNFNGVGQVEKSFWGQPGLERLLITTDLFTVAALGSLDENVARHDQTKTAQAMDCVRSEDTMRPDLLWSAAVLSMFA